MKRKLFNPLLLITGFFIFIAAIADLSGKWTGTITIPGGDDLAVAYDFKVDGTKLTGTADSPAGSVTIDNGKIDGDKFTFSVNVNGTDYPHSGKVYADSCSLDIDFGGQKAHTILKRPVK
jgi:hypothetical protein